MMEWQAAHWMDTSSDQEMMLIPDGSQWLAAADKP